MLLVHNVHPKLNRSKTTTTTTIWNTRISTTLYHNQQVFQVLWFCNIFRFLQLALSVSFALSQYPLNRYKFNRLSNCKCWRKNTKNFAQILKLFFYLVRFEIKNWNVPYRTQYVISSLCVHACIFTVCSTCNEVWQHFKKNVKWEWKEILNQCERKKKVCRKVTSFSLAYFFFSIFLSIVVLTR